MYNTLQKFSKKFYTLAHSIYREEPFIEENSLKELFNNAMKYEKIYEFSPMNSLYTLISRTGQENYSILIRTIKFLSQFEQLKLANEALFPLLDYAISYPDEIWKINQN